MKEVRLIHCADLHIGLGFGGSRYGEQVSAGLKAERLLALENIVRLTNEYKAHFLIIAGDLFDRTTTGTDYIQKTVKVLASCEAEILILPGNHDFYEEGGEGIWSRFLTAAAKLRVTVFTEDRPYVFDTDAGDVAFYPGVCRSKHAGHHVIGWVSAAQTEMKADVLKLGVAHGNVEGFGLGADRYFNMKPEDFRQSGIGLWLLGHIHVPSQYTNFLGQSPLFLFPGSHTPDGFSRIDQDGHCWRLAYSNDSWKGELCKTSNVRFRELQVQLFSSQDVLALQDTVNAMSACESTLLKLELSGRLTAAEIHDCYAMLDALSAKFFHLEYEKSLLVRIDQEYIKATYAEESLPYQLLHSLSLEQEHGLALQLAAKLLEEDKKGGKS